MTTVQAVVVGLPQVTEGLLESVSQGKLLERRCGRVQYDFCLIFWLLRLRPWLGLDRPQRRFRQACPPVQVLAGLRAQACCGKVSI